MPDSRIESNERLVREFRYHYGQLGKLCLLLDVDNDTLSRISIKQWEAIMLNELSELRKLAMQIKEEAFRIIENKKEDASGCNEDRCRA